MGDAEEGRANAVRRSSYHHTPRRTQRPHYMWLDSQGLVRGRSHDPHSGYSPGRRMPPARPAARMPRVAGISRLLPAERQRVASLAVPVDRILPCPPTTRHRVPKVLAGTPSRRSARTAWTSSPTRRRTQNGACAPPSCAHPTAISSTSMWTSPRDHLRARMSQRERRARSTSTVRSPFTQTFSKPSLPRLAALRAHRHLVAAPRRRLPIERGLLPLVRPG